MRHFIPNFIAIHQIVVELWRFNGFWAIVCKTVRPIISDRCPVCPVCLSGTLLYCGQTVSRIKMKLVTQVGVGPGHNVLDGDPAPLP